MAEALLRAEALVRRFGGFTATDGISLEIGRGEFRAIIGPNGAGKTTLFNLLSGALRCNSGRILFDGADVTGLPPHGRSRAGIGRTFQINNVFPDATVFRNIQLAVLAREGATWQMFSATGEQFRQDVEAAAEQVGLAPLLTRPASSLSYGDRRRLEIAIALAGRPKLLLLDEPTSGMSLQERPALIRLIRDIVASGHLTAVLIEHDMDIVFSMAQRISVLHRGRVVADGSPREISASAEVQEIYLGDRDIGF